jgi:hypothetical protein
VCARRTVIVLDLVKADVTVFVLVAVSVTTWVDVELTMGVVVAPIVIVGVNLYCVSLILINGEEVVLTVDVAASPTVRKKSLW